MTTRKPTVADYVAHAVATREAGRDCWLDWSFGTDGDQRPTLAPGKRYGGPQSCNAARFAFRIYHGYWPEWACHRCPNHPFHEDKRCWNPLHVYDGDAATNAQDTAAHFAVKQNIIQGHRTTSIGQQQLGRAVNRRPGSWSAGRGAAKKSRGVAQTERWVAIAQRKFDERLAAERAARSCGLHGCTGDCSHSLGDLLVSPTVCVVKFFKQSVTFSSSPSGALPNDVAELPDALDHLFLRHG